MHPSILDYSPVDEGGTARDALNATTRLADALGFERFWVSEHHHTDSLASTAPEALMMHLAASTDRIRVGSGGVMLPHYSSIKVAENYKLIEALYSNRVDLGFGRALGADHLMTHALNEEKGAELAYADKVRDLEAFVSGRYPAGHRFSGVVARPRLERRLRCGFWGRAVTRPNWRHPKAWDLFSRTSSIPGAAFTPPRHTAGVSLRRPSWTDLRSSSLSSSRSLRCTCGWLRWRGAGARASVPLGADCP